MESDQPAIAPIRTLLHLPAGTGERFLEEWQVVVRRAKIIHDLAVPHDVEPAGAPRLDVPHE